MNHQLFGKAQAKHNAGNYKEAVRLYQMVLMKEPRHLDALYLLGTAYAEQGRHEEARKYLVRAEALSPNSPFVKVNLGNVCRLQGQNQDAFMYYLSALMLQHDLPEARQNLVQVAGLLEDESPEAALACLEYGLMSLWGERRAEALAIMKIGECLDPQNARLRYFIAVLEGVAPDGELRQAFARQEFDLLAAGFDDKLIGELGYGVPGALIEQLQRICGEQLHFASVLDLGCGTGLAGQVLRPVSDRLVGVDISEKMLEKAAGKNLYDELICGDIIEKLPALAADFDLFVAADVLIYLGDAGPLLQALAGKAKPGALLIGSTERGVNGGVQLQQTGRYTHDRQYIEEVLGQNGWQLQEITEINLRKEGERWVSGDLFCARYTAP